MADKKKKSVKMRDLKPSKDAKGGGGGARNTATRNLNTAGARNAGASYGGAGTGKLN